MLSLLFLLLLLLLTTFFLFILFRLFLYRTALIYLLKKWWRWVEDRIHLHQFYKVPQFSENLQDNHFYPKLSTYLNSLASIQDSDFTNLFSAKKSNDIILCLDHNQVVHDTFLGARISWKNQVSEEKRTFVLKIRKKDKRRILQSYLQHIHTVSDEIQQIRTDVKLFISSQSKSDHRNTGRWTSVPFVHPSTMETIVMDPDLKNRVKSDLELFLKSKQYYHRLGRVWKRSYLLYGPSGTGKSSFVAAMAQFLSYDVYDVDLSRVSDDSDLKMLLLQTKRKSVIVVEDLDRFLNENSSGVSFSGLLNFMDGIVNSCCTDGKVMVFTMNCKDLIDPAMLRPGRIDVHIYFPLCDFSSFKTLANSYLGLKEHKLFPQVEEIFQTGATMSPAEIGEIMIMNRGSPSRALKSVITALQTNSDERAAEKMGRRRTEAAEGGGVSWKDVGSPAMKEIRKIYGILRMKSSRKTTVALDLDSGMIQG